MLQELIWMKEKLEIEEREKVERNGKKEESWNAEALSFCFHVSYLLPTYSRVVYTDEM